jgi:hypothetical protein
LLVLAWGVLATSGLCLTLSLTFTCKPKVATPVAHVQRRRNVGHGPGTCSETHGGPKRSCEETDEAMQTAASCVTRWIAHCQGDGLHRGQLSGQCFVGFPSKTCGAASWMYSIARPSIAGCAYNRSVVGVANRAGSERHQIELPVRLGAHVFATVFPNSRTLAINRNWFTIIVCRAVQ